MNDWTSGYVADIGYTYGYYPELNPQRVMLAFLNSGLIPPKFTNACELGFGQGVSTNIHAAASVCSWYGTDFNPAQASFAQELAASSGLTAHLYDEAFDEFTKRDLPEFDYIGLHGIWSWISDENRVVIVDFIKKKLKVGGVLYISYNTLPGWGSFAPLRHLMTEHAEIMGSDGSGIVSRIDGALAFTERLLATDPLYARANPHVSEKINRMKAHDRHYLAHEYFNRDWQPMHFGTMAKWMNSAKLTYACSANYIDLVDDINLTKEQKSFLSELVDPIFRQSVRDFLVNQQFRKDFWVKGARSLSNLEQSEALHTQRLIMIKNLQDVTLSVAGAIGEAKLNEAIYLPILNLMSDYRVRTIAQIKDATKELGITFAQLIQSVLVLCGKGVFSTVQVEEDFSMLRIRTEKLNTLLMQKARSSNEITYLASPLTGGGVFVGRFQQLFLMAIQNGKNSPVEWATYVSKLLTSQGQKIVKADHPIESPEEQLVELTKQAKDFAIKELPILKALKII